MFKNVERSLFSWFFFPSILENLEKVLENLPILPELFLLTATLVLLVYGLVKNKNSYNYLVVKEFTRLSVIILSITAGLVWVNLGMSGKLLYENILVLDFGSSSIKLFCLLVSIVCLIMSRSALDRSRSACFEYFILYLFVVFGVMFFISSVDLFTMFLALEIQSICLYALVSLNKGSGYGVEAGIKFFVLGATSSVILIFGISMLYGAAGSTNLFHLYNIFLYHVPNLLWNTVDAGMFCLTVFNLKLILGVLFVFIGLFFKITIVPFHMWAPDVYEGAPISIVIFVSTVPKIAVTYILCKLAGFFFAHIYFVWQSLFIVAGLLSVVIGTFMAVRQFKIKRFIAYSSITHMGYILLFLSAFTFVSLQYCICYLFVYVSTILSLWGVLLVLENNFGKSLDSFYDWGGIFYSERFLAIILAITLLSLGGLPPFSGFFGKYLFFKSLLLSDMYIIALFLIVFSLLSIYYYVKIIKIIFFDSKIKFLVIKKKIDFSLAFLINIFLIIILFFFHCDIVWSLSEKIVWSIYVVI